jgi:asparagine synthase (glutamine-hydrolysing)
MYANSNGADESAITSMRDTVNAAMQMDLQDYMPGDILVKTDRASMAHGLELRAPFLDVEFASFCISLPDHLKITDRQDKWILRQCYGKFWTEAIRGKRKQGFGAPVGDWLKLPGVAQLKSKVLDNSHHSLFSLIPFEASRAYVAKDNYQTWILLTLGLWLEQGGEKSL